ncbi:hypothetical protein CRG98_033537 [Punica granatum]|uniref:Uncharacterized protein n=1 Tax=Punica granatum TaxID=22663 RepID=A0A2I0IQ11_PUNGR|nr:hypothetical protein CRG98_033537 [Punica granatum]
MQICSSTWSCLIIGLGCLLGSRVGLGLAYSKRSEIQLHEIFQLHEGFWIRRVRVLRVRRKKRIRGLLILRDSKGMMILFIIFPQGLLKRRIWRECGVSEGMDVREVRMHLDRKENESSILSKFPPLILPEEVACLCLKPFFPYKVMDFRGYVFPYSSRVSLVNACSLILSS